MNIKVFAFDTKYNTPFWRRSRQPVSWFSTAEAKSNRIAAKKRKNETALYRKQKTEFRMRTIIPPALLNTPLFVSGKEGLSEEK